VLILSTLVLFTYKLLSIRTRNEALRLQTGSRCKADGLAGLPLLQGLPVLRSWLVLLTSADLS